jgi:hypothetical protein
LIEKTGRGILAMLDEECKVPKGTDTGFLERVDASHRRNPCFGIIFMNFIYSDNCHLVLIPTTSPTHFDRKE